MAFELESDPRSRVEYVAGSYAYVIPLEKFVYRHGEHWIINEPVGQDGIRHHLLALGASEDLIQKNLKDNDYAKVHGWDMFANSPPLVRRGDRTYLNTWVPPELKPVAGEWPRISRLLSWLTNGDEAAITWLLHWVALKVQNPEIVPKVAVVLAGEQGSGKGTLALIIRHMLGLHNTATITRYELENKFNARWIEKLFVLADEVISNEKVKDVSNYLKVLIDGAEVESDAKNVKQRAVKNRLAWLFASNDRTTPVTLENGDRRYTVLSNYERPPRDYTEMLNGCFEADRLTPTPAFVEEMSAFFHDMLQWKVDRGLVARPYENEARSQLIEATQTPHDLFFKHVDENGIDDLLDHVLTFTDYEAGRSRAEWDHGTKGVSVQMVYRCYVEFTKRVGGKPMKLTRFGIAVHNHKWNVERPTVPGTGKQVRCYVVPRRPAKPTKSVPTQGKADA